MKGVASGSDCSTIRENVLEEFGAAVASMPWDLDRIRKGIEEVAKAGGFELCIESAATCGAFESITKIVDATGRKVDSEFKDRVMKSAMTMAKYRNTIFFMGASIAVAIVATRLIR